MVHPPAKCDHADDREAENPVKQPRDTSPTRNRISHHFQIIPINSGLRRPTEFASERLASVALHRYPGKLKCSRLAVFPIVVTPVSALMPRKSAVIATATER
jgi:hypothetical protein